MRNRGRKPKRLKKKHTDYVQANIRNCKACWKCINACPKQVIGKISFLWHKHIVIQSSENCTGCKKCIKICPHGVLVETKKKFNFTRKTDNNFLNKSL